MKAESVGRGQTLWSVDAAACSVLLADADLFLSQDIKHFPEQVHTNCYIIPGAPAKWSQVKRGRNAERAQQEVWNTEKFYSCSHSKLLYSKWSHVAHRFKSAWALQSAKKKKLRSHLEHNHIHTLLCHKCVQKHGQWCTPRWTKTITTTS